MENKRPTSRKKRVTDNAKSVYRRGEGLGTGSAGNNHPNNFGGKTENIQVTGKTGSGRNLKRGGSALSLVAIAALLLFGGNNLLGGGSGSGAPASTPAPTAYVATSTPSPKPTPKPQATPSSGINYGISPDSYNNILGSSSSVITHTDTSSVDTSVSSGAREKRTVIRGDGKDQVTIMIYMCGTDLESRSSMATKDLVEMANSNFNDNVRIIVYTGGCSRWNNSVVASDRNQIYEVKKGGLERLEANAGNAAMTDPNTLATFIKYCKKNFPANRNELILWDHGGGSVTGYGYDEKYSRSKGSMTLAGINEALKAGGVTFDFVGFDACLMATLETGLMLDKYADYMIASEETEPGIGWYYTNWLSRFAANPAMPTVEVGKNIVDDFVNTCATQTRGQSATLSVVDLAELAASVPAPLKDFSLSLTELIKGNHYQQVSSARNGTREFARSTAIDQIDLVHFAKNLGTGEGKQLISALQKAIKYNRTSANMSDAYGLSIYFPYRKANKVDAACSTYDAIGMDESYSDCIRAFASLEVSGQAASGVGGYQIPSILSGGYSSSPSGDVDLISELLGAFLSGGYQTVPGYSSGNTGFFVGRALSEEDTARYIAENSFDPTLLVWTLNENGENVISLPTEQWELVNDIEYNLFYDDGNGYIDLGLDALFSFDDNWNLLEPEDNTWIAINGQPVAFYHDYTLGEGDDAIITGHVPALVNGVRVNIMISFDPDHPYGIITGVLQDYVEGETETVAKQIPALTDNIPIENADWNEADQHSFWNVGDTIEFVCDYYTYAGVYQDNFKLGDPMTVTEDMMISNVPLEDANLRISFRFTDLYQQHYWTQALYR